MSRNISIVRYDRGKAHGAVDAVAIEEPLEIRLRWRANTRYQTRAVTVTMRTPGHDQELAAGFLYAEQMISGAADIVRIDVSGEHANEITVELKDGLDLDWERVGRNFYTTSSCGVCGKTSLEALAIEDASPLEQSFRVSPSVLVSLPELLRDAQTDFAATGGLHAAGLFTADGRFLAAREDVGRHNAADKLVGHYVLSGDPDLSATILTLSGRASYELLQKAWRARIGVVAAVGAPSSLAIDVSRRFGITLIGFLRDSRFNVYAHPDRIAGCDA